MRRIIFNSNISYFEGHFYFPEFRKISANIVLYFLNKKRMFYGGNRGLFLHNYVHILFQLDFLHGEILQTYFKGTANERKFLQALFGRYANGQKILQGNVRMWHFCAKMPYPKLDILNISKCISLFPYFIFHLHWKKVQFLLNSNFG